MDTSKKTTTFLIFLFILALIIGLVFASLHYNALNYHKDFSFYLQFIAKLFNPELSNRYSFNASGHNFFGMITYEGALGFHHTVHFELIKYPFAVLYAISRSPFTILFVFTALYFSPILQLGFYQKAKSTHEQIFISLIAALLIFYPLVYPAAINDIRPRMLYNAAIPLLILSIYYQRPKWEQIAAFIFFLSLREESVIFSIPIILFSFLEHKKNGTNKSIPFTFFGLWLLYLIGIILFYTNAGYIYDPAWDSFFSIRTNPPLLIALGIIGLGILGIAAFIYSTLNKPSDKNSLLNKWAGALKQDEHELFYKALQLITYGGLLLPILAQFYIWLKENFIQSGIVSRRIMLTQAIKALFYSEHLGILFVSLLIFVFLIWQYFPVRKLRLIITSALVILLATSLYLSAINVWPSLYNQALLDKAEAAGIIFDLRNKTLASEDSILTDFTTYHAFFEYENVYVYERLPWYVVSGDTRYFDENIEYLDEIMIKEIEFIAVSINKQGTIEALLNRTNLDTIIYAENDLFIIYKIIK